MKKYYNATDAAKYLGISRQRFYVVKYKYGLEQTEDGFAKAQLDKVRKAMDAWLVAHGK